jgi:hypothetical protein
MKTFAVLLVISALMLAGLACRMREAAYATITIGRVDKGMPAWKDLLGEKGIQNVLGFLESVQRQP